MAAVLLGLSYSYSYSDTITTGVTNNAAGNGVTWNMNDVLPPEAGITINNVFYRYTITKDRNSDAQVTIQNENAVDGGYIFSHTDNWNKLPGSTINKLIPLEDIPRVFWGDGSISVNGDAEISNPTVAYSYRTDLCYNPLFSPECPGYWMALYQWLLDNGLINQQIDVNDPYFDKYVQEALNRITIVEEQDEQKEVVEEKKEQEESIEDKLSVAGAAEKLADATAQAAMLKAMANLPIFEPYYSSNIPGGSYNETIKLIDKELPDNRRAMGSLAQQRLHSEMVDSQYNR